MTQSMNVLHESSHTDHQHHELDVIVPHAPCLYKLTHVSTVLP